MTMLVGLFFLLLPLTLFGSVVSLLRLADVIRRQRENLEGVRR